MKTLKTLKIFTVQKISPDGTFSAIPEHFTGDEEINAFLNSIPGIKRVEQGMTGEGMTGEGMTGALPVFKDKDDNGYMVFLEEMSERDLERARKMAQNW